MSWFHSIVIGFLTAVVGCLGAGVVASQCVRWYRISSFEGAAGYYVVFIALLGAVVGLIGGIVCSRYVPATEGAMFLKGLGIATGGMGGLLLLVLIICRLAADLPPEMNGRSLELAVEVRCPEGFAWPVKVDDYGAFAGVDLPGGRRQPTGKLRLEEAVLVDGRWVVPATVPLETSVNQKYFRAYFNRENDAFFGLRLRSHPNGRDLNWSPWIESGWNTNQPEPAPEKEFKLRYRVQEIIPPPPGPTREEMEAEEAAEEQAKFDAISPGAPIIDWLPYTRYGAREDRLQIAVKHITGRESFVQELGALMTSPEQEIMSDALRLVEHLPNPPAALLAPVAEAGRAIATLMRKVNATTVDEDPSYFGAADISLRFSAWMVAARTLREKSGGDFTAELNEILELSRVRADSYVMRVDVLRVASYYMQQWAGLAPLATDPKPR
jgi:hypothetical protein